jgi:hypothetical protein
MKNKIILTILMMLAVKTVIAQTTVSSQSDLWLAGMPNGSTASYGDSAPGQSPVQVTGLSIIGGASFSFSASGAVNDLGSFSVEAVPEPNIVALTTLGFLVFWLTKKLSAVFKGIRDGLLGRTGRHPDFPPRQTS